MGVFARFRRRSSTASTEEATAATQTKGSAEAAVDASGETSKSSDGVEIPKQQSAEEAADSEAGEGARQ
ncbi:gliding motility protein [Streptomyces sp. 8N706]|uniref:gliding motility protein n=1 Tax=Streptomyces sp. 8N706 TaxID=3457416 RepID=UPI003FCF5E0A